MTSVSAPVPSVAWRVNAERLVLLGWGRAILLQLAHPLIAAGVFEHSDFRGSPLAAVSRLHHTVRAMLGLTFGDPAQRARTLDNIRQIHRRVHGQLPDTVGPWAAGTPYSAEDPDLVLWVHATLLESVLLVHDRLVEPLSEHDRDAYCEEALPVAVELCAREAEVPRTWRALRAYLERTCATGAIAVGPQARALARAVLAPDRSWPVAPATWVNRTVTGGLLPPAIREQYGIPWTDARQRRFERLMRGLRLTRRGLPAPLALWPQARRLPTPSAGPT